MNRWHGFLGVAGIVALLFGIIGGFAVGSFTEPMMVTHLLVGVIFLVLWFLLSGVQTLASAGDVVRGRAVRFGVGATINVVLVVAVLAIANWAVRRDSVRWDLTEQGVYSLALQSVSAVAGLQKPLKIVAFTGTGAIGANEAKIKDLLAMYKSAGSKVNAEVVDAGAKPHLVDRYAMSAGNVVYIEYGEGQASSVSRINDGSEEAITNAILKLTRGEAKKVYFVEGHGEADITSGGPEGIKSLATAMGDEHMTVASLLLASHQSVPEDAAALVVVNPRKPFLPQERAMIIAYVEKGGRLLVFAEPQTTDDLRALTAHFGVTIGEGVVLDQVQRLFAGPALSAQFAAKDYGAHPVTKALTQRDVTVFTIATSVKGATESGNGVTYTTLVSSSPSAWAESDLAKLFDENNPTAELGEGDLKGPVPLAVAYEKNLSPGAEQSGGDTPKFEARARVLVVGDSDLVMNNQLASYGNRDFAMNAVNWLIGEEGGVTIRPRSMRVSAAPIAEGTFLGILGASFLVPEMILLLGLLVWWRRRTLASA